MKVFTVHLNIFYLYVVMGKNPHLRIQLIFQVSPHPSVFAMTFNVGVICPNVTTTNHAVITLKSWELIGQYQVCSQVLQLVQRKDLPACMVNACLGCYNLSMSNVFQWQTVEAMGVINLSLQ
jgi:hypothetical protein